MAKLSDEEIQRIIAAYERSCSTSKNEEKPGTKSSANLSKSPAKSSRKYSTFDEYVDSFVKGSNFNYNVSIINDLYKDFKHLKSSNSDIADAYKDALKCIALFRKFYILEALYKDYNPSDYRYESKKFKLKYPLNGGIEYLHYVAVDEYGIDYSDYEDYVLSFITDSMRQVVESCDIIESMLPYGTFLSEFQTLKNIIYSTLTDSCRYSFQLTPTGQQVLKDAKRRKSRNSAKTVGSLIKLIIDTAP